MSWTIGVERKKRARFAYNPVTEIHVYAMDIPIPQEPQENDLVSNEFVSREIPSESLQPPEGVIESSVAMSMNDCKDICFWMLLVLCYELCSCFSSFSRNIYQVSQRAIGVGCESSMNKLYIEEFDEVEYVA